MHDNFISGSLLIYTLLIHTSRGKRDLKYGRDSQRTDVKVEKKRFHFRKKNGGTKSKQKVKITVQNLFLIGNTVAY